MGTKLGTPTSALSLAPPHRIVETHSFTSGAALLFILARSYNHVPSPYTIFGLAEKSLATAAHPMDAHTDFTFYGDLLGIGAAYQLSPRAAYDKLDRFYNTVFTRFEPICEQPSNRFHVQMFSDCVVMWGKAVGEILEPLQQVYLDLIEKNLLLRGALVDGALKKEPRVQAENFRKFLPTNDTLARAVGLEKTVKGARLLIESNLAGKLLKSCPEWLTLEGYMEHPHSNVPASSVLRRICPAPSGNSYELLYFWGPIATPHEAVSQRLREIAEFQDTYVAEHLRETLKVLKRSETRRRRTEQALSQG